jgi:CheY-like chemotaxis protein
VHAHDVMPEGGRVIIETGHRILTGAEGALAAGRYATITFRDSGPPLTPDQDARLFLPFAPTTALPQDSGISLASSLATLRELGGDIQVHSTPETGTIFVLFVPEAQGVEEPSAATPPESLTILVVDDDDNARDLIVDSLLSAGFTVLGASDGPAAIAIAQSRGAGSIDLLVTDVVMPRMTGLRVAQALRDTYPNMRVLYVSGYTDRQDLPVESSETRSAFLGKPFTRGALLGRVKALLDATDQE